MDVLWNGVKHWATYPMEFSCLIFHPVWLSLVPGHQNGKYLKIITEDSRIFHLLLLGIKNEWVSA